MRRPGTRINRILLSLLIILLPLGQGGCWSIREINNLAIVLGVGIDKPSGSSDEIELTIQVALPSVSAGPGATGTAVPEKTRNVSIFSARGETVDEAQKRLAQKCPREIYWSHCMLMVIGEEMARSGTHKITNFFMRATEPREFMWVMVSRGPAKKIMEANSVLEKIPVGDITSVSRIKMNHYTMFRELVDMISTPGVGATVPQLELTTEEKAGKDGGNSQKEGGGAAPGEASDKTSAKSEFDTSGTAVFKKDKLVGFLSSDEAEGFQWINGSIHEKIVTIPGLDKPEEKMSLLIHRAMVKVSPELNDGKPRITVDILTEGELQDQQGTEDTGDPVVLRELNQQTAATIEEICRKTIEKSQRELEADIFRFGEAVHRRYPREWKEIQGRWEEEYVNLPVVVSVDAHIRRTSIITRPLFENNPP